MANRPRFNFPDMTNSKTVAHQSEAGGQIQEFFGPSRHLVLDPTDNTPIESLTLAKAYEGNNQYLTNILHYNFVNGSGWWFAFAPLVESQGLNQIWSVYTWDRVAMEPAPEDTAPRYLTFRKEDHIETLTRFNLGFDMRHDFYKRPEGRSMMDTQMAQLVSGGWITAKLLVGQAVANSKLHWREWQQQYGPEYTSVLEAMNDEIRLFGAISKDERAIYKLHAHVLEITREANFKPTMVVLGRGSMQFLALSGTYETEAYKRGESVVQQRLSMGAQSMVGVLPGVTIYEDELFALQNVGPDEIHQFVRVATIGRYFMVDGSDFGEHMNSYPASKALSVKHASMDIDAWKKMSINVMIDNNMRFDEMGELSEYHQKLTQEYQSVLQRSGIQLHNDAYLDPYIWYDEKHGEYHVIEHWGDMDKHYFTLQQNIRFGEMAAKNTRCELRAEDLDDIAAAKAEIDRMYQLEDLTSASFQGFMFALAANPENQSDGLLLAGNRHAAPMPPHRQAHPASDTGVMYVMKNGEPHYVFVVEAAGGAAPEKLAPAGSPVAFFIAPLTDFGASRLDVSLDVAAADWNPAPLLAGDANTNGTRPPKLVRAPKVIPYGTINAFRTLAQMHAEGNTRGWDAKVAEVAFKGVRALDKYMRIEKRRNPDCVLFDPKYTPFYMLTGDHEEDSANSVISSVWDHVKMPIWVRIPANISLATGHDYDAVLTPGPINIAIAPNIVTTEFRMEDVTELMKLMGLSDDGSGNQKSGPLAMTDSVLSEILLAALRSDALDPAIRTALKDHNAGNAHSTAAKIFRAYEKNLGGAYADLVERKGTKGIPRQFGYFILREIRKNRIVDRNDERGIRKLATEIGVVLGLAQSALLGSTHRYTADNISDIIDEARAFAVTSARKRAAVREPIEQEGEVDVDSAFFDPDSEFTDKIRMRDEDGAKVYAGSNFINTRLSVSDKAFHTLARIAQSNNTDDLLRVETVIVRPSDPANASKPLAGDLRKEFKRGQAVVNAGPADNGKLRDNLQRLQLARALAPSRNTGYTIFGNLSLISDQASRKRHHMSLFGVSEEEELRQEKEIRKSSRRNPYAKGPNHMPPRVSNDPDGPLYASTTSTLDRNGQPIADSEKIIAKKFLAWRFDQLSTKITDDLARVPAQLLCFSRVTKRSLKTWVSESLPIPDCCIIIAQPWIRIRMSSGLWAVGGSQTANLMYNYEDAVIQFNGQNKTWHVHYTIWLNCAIWDPSRFIIIQDVKFEGYISGMDDSINNSNDSSVWNPADIDPSQLKACFIFSLGANFGRDVALKVANPLSLFGKYDIRALPFNFAERHRVFSVNGPLHPAVPYYELVWNFSELNKNTDTDFSTFAAIRNTGFITGLMPMATHIVFDPATGDLTKKIPGTGHLDAFEPPMRQILNGKVPFVADKRYY